MVIMIVDSEKIIDIDLRNCVGRLKSLLQEKDVALNPDQMTTVLQKSRWFVESCIKSGWILKDEEKICPANSVGMIVKTAILHRKEPMTTIFYLKARTIPLPFHVLQKWMIMKHSTTELSS
jgi:hypothetical protein